MHIPALLCGLALLALAGCENAPPPQPASDPPPGAEAANAPQPLGARLSGSRLDLRSGDGEAPPMVIRLNADGTSVMSMGGIALTARWQAEGDTLCQTDLRLDGVPSDDTTPQCVQVSVSGDRITLVGAEDGGAPETFTGTISPL